MGDYIKSTVPTGIIPASNLQPGERVLGLCRVTGRRQVLNGSLIAQADDLDAACRQLKLPPLLDICSIQETARLGRPRPEFEKVLEEARRLRAGLIVLNVLRLFRPHIEHGGAIPTEADAEEFLHLYGYGICFFASILPPSATPLEIRQSEIRRGQQASPLKPGRPRIPRNSKEQAIFEKLRQIHESQKLEIMAACSSVTCACLYCGKLFMSKRRDAIWCCDAHRQAARRGASR